MNTGDLTLVHLADYAPPAFNANHHDMTFYIEEAQTTVVHRQQFVRIQAKEDAQGWALEQQKDLVLDGEGLELLDIRLDNLALEAQRWRYEQHQLTIFDVPDSFELETTVRLYPDDNKELSGLYRSNGVYCTQCEAQGFRRISFALDRPDALATYRVRIESDEATTPVQLSNGNLELEGSLGDGRHFSEWHDPHPKPSYLFALVAGDLAQVGRRITTKSGKSIDLRIYTEAAFIDQTDFAMQALIDSINWDEKRFNLAYDLGRFNIVAVSDFNMGAMENKSLNIFNSCYVLGQPQTATDDNFHAIRSIIGHEYFHNWTGNRITCRDWFQLSLKEGLTVFRDQEFSADMGEASIERIKDVNRLRQAQFPEDAGPLSHPVQPQSYAAIDNFYTATVYEKGAEIIRMMHTIIGEEAFQRGIALYIERHDGQAVRIEDFAACMSEASGFDFSGQFFDWYTTSGTPKLYFTSAYNQLSSIYTLSVGQNVNALKPEKPLLVPIKLSLMRPNGRLYKFDDGSYSKLLLLDSVRGSWTFTNAEADLIPVLMQGFSAPVVYHYHYSDAELAALVNHAEDGFVRFEAMQIGFKRLFTQSLNQPQTLANSVKAFTQLFSEILANPERSAQEKALLLALPTLAEVISQQTEAFDIDTLIAAYERVERIVALKVRLQLLDYLRQSEQPASARYTVDDAGKRALRGVVMRYLAIFDEAGICEDLYTAYQQANCMTERLNALQALNRQLGDKRQLALADFIKRYEHYPLVVDKWFSVQALSDDDNALARITALCQDTRFVITNPNRFRAIISTFSQQNLKLFHAADGSGYRFVISQIERLILLNPQLCARLLQAFTPVSKMDAERRATLHTLLADLLLLDNISIDIREIIERLQAGLQ